MRPRFSMLAKLMKWLMVVAWVVVASELYLRAVAPVAIVPRYIAATPYGIRGNEPGKSYWQTSAEYAVEIRINSKGIRADEVASYEKPRGVKRIVVLGDSFGMGYEVDLRDTFLTRMTEELRAAGVPVEVINLSVSGHGNAEELITLREEGLKYQPDLVLLSWHASDCPDNVRCGLFTLANGELIQQQTSYLPGVRAQRVLYSFAPFEWIATRSHLYCFARELVALHVVKPLLLFLQSETASGGAEGEQIATASVDRYQTELTIALLKEIDRTARSRGAQFLILEIPIRESRTTFRDAFPREIGGTTFGLPVVSPIEKFRQNVGEMIYWERSHGHFTPHGSRLVGHVLADHILRSKALSSRGEEMSPPS